MENDNHNELDLSLFGHRLRISRARAVLYLGLALFGVLVAETALLLVLAPELVWPVLRGLLAEVTAGREGGIPVFLEGGVPPLLTMQYSATQDLMTSFIVYPLFLYLLERYHDRDNFIMRRVRKIEESAERNEKRVHRYGPVFLFVFMLMPFIVNGPLVGLVLGRLAKLRMTVLLPLVVAATVVPAVAWTLFYGTLFSLIEEAVPGGKTYITVGVLGLIAVFLLTAFIIEKVKDGKEKRKEGGKRRPDPAGHPSGSGSRSRRAAPSRSGGR
jgi:uncharacterized membrane protein